MVDTTRWRGLDPDVFRIADDRLPLLDVIRLHVTGDSFDDPEVCVHGNHAVAAVVLVKELVRASWNSVSWFCCCGS